MAKISIDLKSGNVEKNQAVIGIDLGTTNSLIASVDSEGKPYCISIDGASIVPSAVHFGDDILSVGQDAIAQMVKTPENTIYSVKRLMGKSHIDLGKDINFFNYSIIDTEDKLVQVKVKDKFYSPIELSSLVLKKLKTTAEEHLNAEVNKVVITVPAYFNDTQRQATRDAGKLAGMDVLRIINEPTAASLAYGLGLKSESGVTIAVYDLGGGTFDISILRIQNGIYEVLATNGDTFLGGDDFDMAIVNHWKSSIGIKPQNKSEEQVLRLSAEEAKRKVNDENDFTKNVKINKNEIELKLNLETYNSLILDLVEKSLACSSNALKDAELKTDDIDEVILVGGSTKNRLVHDKISAFFQKSKINYQINPDEIVALGAAIEADILAGNRRDMLLLDVTPLSLGIETLGGLMDVVVPRNNKVPTTYKKEYTTSVDGQVNLKISVFQGEREMVKDNRRLGAFILTGIPAMPAGFPKIEVTFMLNADGILKVSAEELRSHTKQEVEMQPQYGISEQEIETMLKSSIENAESDMAERSLAEAKSDANQLIYSTENFIRKNPELVSKNEIEKINEIIELINLAMKQQNKDEISLYSERLNEYTKPFAEKVINASVSNALKGKKIE